ncbi:hypothetical protein [Corynebacterium hesseae]
MTSIHKDLITGVWHVCEGDAVFPAASWGEALRFVHEMGEHRTKNKSVKKRVRRKPTKGQIVAEEYEHFEMILGPKLAVQRLAAVYHTTPKTIRRHIQRWSSPQHDLSVAAGG